MGLSPARDRSERSTGLELGREVVTLESPYLAADEAVHGSSVEPPSDGVSTYRNDPSSHRI